MIRCITYAQFVRSEDNEADRVKNFYRARSSVAVVVGALVVVAAGAAWATTVDCKRYVHCSGTKGDDTLNGTRKADSMRGLPGDDTLLGRAGSDRLHGGPGTDELRAGRGPDHIRAGEGHDHLFGQKGNDALEADPKGDPGPYWYQRVDQLYGGRGHDELHGNLGDELYGGPGNDKLYGSRDFEHFYGGPGDDILYGRVERDKGFVDTYFFESGWGHDTIVDGPTGSLGNFLRLDDVTEDLHIYLTARPGRSEVRSADGSSTIQWDDDAINRLYAGQGDDVIRGDARQNRIKVRSGGNDTVYGRGGNDRIGARDRPGRATSSDTIHGGSGNDRIDVTDKGVNGAPDFVDCGPGDNDRVSFDVGIDTVINCEVMTTDP